MASDPKDTNIFSLTMLQQVINFIEKNLLEALTPAVIAAHFFVSVSSLSSLFKIVCGITIMEYIRNRRLTLAAQELSSSNIPVIELAYKYGYETPEAFTKAFSRFHGFPPSFVRRGFPTVKAFLPLQVEATIRGGWNTAHLTKADSTGQDRLLPFSYNTFIKDEGGINQFRNGSARKNISASFEADDISLREKCTEMEHRNWNKSEMGNQKIEFQIDTSNMLFKREWNILCSVSENLLQNQIPFKIDGKTMIFAHGLEFPLDKICLTFKWNDAEAVKYFFHYNREVKHVEDGFKYFDAIYEEMTIRCMFYNDLWHR